ncbi:hypothetical protein OHC33_008133 [Knufia fluminis]|uniref:Uncharacterized protein n=1 Tax=Knufia fluminis TaxID=191047 RepID=A0AAN8I541_9EURO|nr:hypothetical protein OHC33_008133 [Knufia fluminis]
MCDADGRLTKQETHGTDLLVQLDRKIAGVLSKLKLDQLPSDAKEELLSTKTAVTDEELEFFEQECASFDAVMMPQPQQTHADGGHFTAEELERIEGNRVCEKMSALWRQREDLRNSPNPPQDKIAELTAQIAPLNHYLQMRGIPCEDGRLDFVQADDYGSDWSNRDNDEPKEQVEDPQDAPLNGSKRSSGDASAIQDQAEGKTLPKGLFDGADVEKPLERDFDGDDEPMLTDAEAEIFARKTQKR